ncbi:MAG: dTDP-4-dehydrorhamnose 3,5-epimerase [Candidatus Brocadiales bacterium]|nr:dTDP-4-dehydrorhamnose 3,5-epimerase [Candidatus Brocadiales bacterium]
MKFNPTLLSGAFIVEPEFHEDERGGFSRSFCRKEFEDMGLNPNIAQCNISFNKKKGTLRGMHYQVGHHAEAKLVRCTKGSIYDVIIDLRPEMPEFKKWFSVELSAENQKMLYIPEGFAHGFQTLTDNTEIFYQMSGFYFPDSARGVRWDDPCFNIKWPDDNRIISQKDLDYSDFNSINE